MIGNNKIASIGNRIYDVYDVITYAQLGKPERAAIEIDNMVFPVISKNSNDYGAKVYNGYVKFIVPEDKEKKKIFEKSDNYIDFSDISSMKELLDKNAVATDLERTVLTSPDDITVCKRNESDSAAITVLKDAIDAKKIDIHTYQHNFGSNYTNDLRILDSDDITLKKMITFCRNLDMSMSITIEDSDKDIANPMNQIFTTKII